MLIQLTLALSEHSALRNPAIIALLYTAITGLLYDTISVIVTAGYTDWWLRVEMLTSMGTEMCDSVFDEGHLVS